MNYLHALQAIFNNAKEYVQKTTTDSKLDMWDMAKKMVDYLGEIIEHLSFCMILTTDPDDAYTLFEVLNDRALDVDDLELVKNHFYKVYCQHSPQISDSDKNKEIDIDTIFHKGYTEKENHSGIGLWEVRKLLSKNNNVNLFTTKTDSLFKQQLEIYFK